MEIHKINKKEIRTDISTLVRLVRERREIKVEDAAHMMGMDEETVENVAKILVKHRILEIHYSLKGTRILKRGERIITASMQKTQEKDISATPESKKTVDNEPIFKLIRARRHKKKDLLPASITHGKQIYEGKEQHAAVLASPDDLYSLKEAFVRTREDVEKLRRKMEEDPFIIRAEEPQEANAGLPEY